MDPLSLFTISNFLDDKYNIIHLVTSINNMVFLNNTKILRKSYNIMCLYKGVNNYGKFKRICYNGDIDYEKVLDCMDTLLSIDESNTLKLIDNSSNNQVFHYLDKNNILEINTNLVNIIGYNNVRKITSNSCDVLYDSMKIPINYINKIELSNCVKYVNIKYVNNDQVFPNSIRYLRIEYVLNPKIVFPKNVRKLHIVTTSYTEEIPKIPNKVKELIITLDNNLPKLPQLLKILKLTANLNVI